jgi:hypothetical protein
MSSNHLSFSSLAWTDKDLIVKDTYGIDRLKKITNRYFGFWSNNFTNLLSLLSSISMYFFFKENKIDLRNNSLVCDFYMLEYQQMMATSPHKEFYQNNCVCGEPAHLKGIPVYYATKRMTPIFEMGNEEIACPMNCSCYMVWNSTNMIQCPLKDYLRLVPMYDWSNKNKGLFAFTELTGSMCQLQGSLPWIQ